MAKATQSYTFHLSLLIRDPIVRAAFERAERDNRPEPVEADRPKVLTGGEAEKVMA
jgi:hypothetical protein